MHQEWRSGKLAYHFRGRVSLYSQMRTDGGLELKEASSILYACKLGDVTNKDFSQH